MFLNLLDNYEVKKVCLIFMIELVNMIFGREVGWDFFIYLVWRLFYFFVVRGLLSLN